MTLKPQIRHRTPPRNTVTVSHQKTVPAAEHQTVDHIVDRPFDPQLKAVAEILAATDIDLRDAKDADIDPTGAAPRIPRRPG